MYIDNLLKAVEDLEKAARNYIMVVEEHRDGCGLPIWVTQKKFIEIIDKTRKLLDGHQSRQGNT